MIREVLAGALQAGYKLATAAAVFGIVPYAGPPGKGAPMTAKSR